MSKFVAGRGERFDVLSTRLWRETVEDTSFANLGAGRVQVTIDAISNDTDYLAGRMWGMYGDKTTPVNLYGSQAGEAWAAGHIGSMKVAIGVIDSGVDYTHSDLYSNIWLNQGEIPFAMRGLLVDTDSDKIITFRDLNSVVNGGFVTDLNANGRIDGGDLLSDIRWANGVDEAGNGYTDDLIGWDFANNDNNPMDDNGHGTHVAGTVGARGGDGIGVAGVAWNTQIVALKFMDAAGSGYSDAAARAVDYFTTAKSSSYGIDFAATNNSWGGGGYTQDLQDAINRAAKADILFVASAGNGGSDGIGDDNDVSGYYPANYTTKSAAGYDAVISVAAIANNGTLASFSNYGDVTVDIGAPGVGIYSTLKGGGWGYMSGTSMAAPHVAGAIALFSAANPGYSAAQIRAELLSSGSATASLAGKTVTGKRLDVAEFVSVAPAPSPPPTPTPTPTPTPSPTPSTLYGTTGNDTVRGTSANEKIYGIAASDAKIGTGTRDFLYGGGGADVFVLGDSRGLFYNDGLAGSSGRTDSASIRDFDSNDRVQLSGTASDYVLKAETLNLVAGTSIFRDTNGSGSWDKLDEFVSHVSGSATARALTKDYLRFDGAGTPTPTPSPSVPAIYGTAANDTLNGTASSEKIFGIGSADAKLGTGTRDIVRGGGGADIFVLGDPRGLFYNDNLASSAGRSDSLSIRDFGADDKIQLSGQMSDYVMKSETLGGVAGISIFHDSNDDGRWNSLDEFVAHVSGASAPPALTPDYFVFV
jgi:subtilisin family serine protease